MPAFTPLDVASFAPDAPAVTPAQLLEAQDWADPLLERAGVTLVPTTRQQRAADRAVMAYAVFLATTGKVAAGALDTQRVVKLKDGADEIQFAVQDAATVAALPSAWLAQAWRYLTEAGVPRPPFGVGASA